MNSTPSRPPRRLVALLGLALSSGAFAQSNTVPIETIDLATAVQANGRPVAGQSNGHHPLTINGTKFDTGVGTVPGFKWQIDVGGQATQFKAMVGIDDEARPPTTQGRPPTTQGQQRRRNVAAEFKVVADGKVVFRSGPMRVGDQPKAIDVPLDGVKTLVLAVLSNNDQNTSVPADWAAATLAYAGAAAPKGVAIPADEAVILTPPPAATPRINGPKVVGVRPTHPLIYTVPVTGERPMKVAAEGLPAGLTLDASNGLITGSVEKAGSYPIKLTATNDKGTANATVNIEVGDKIALTPPLGWNSWNCFAGQVSDEKIRGAADAMVNNGLINHGWTYINIDDCWEIRANEPAEKRRAPDGTILTNSKFPDMKALADYVHGRGLKIGLYSSPGPATCGGFTASYQHEEQDAKTYADWGFDYLKYDWCSYGNIYNEQRRQPNHPSELEMSQLPYKVMGDALKKQNRDILYSFCQYGSQNVWEWGESLGGQCWRTTGDIVDTWHSMTTIGFAQNGHEKYAGPGHWNDPDMMVVGKVGWGGNLRSSRLSPSEQYTHVTLWSMLNSPLLIGCDLTAMDDFTKSLLTNDEVIAVNQDTLGQQAHRVSQNTENETEVWMKDMADGSKIVGLFNRNEVPLKIDVKWSQLGVNGQQTARDLWRQKDVTTAADGLNVEVASHGAAMFKIAATTVAQR